jgi:hypothetical protein
MILEMITGLLREPLFSNPRGFDVPWIFSKIELPRTYCRGVMRIRSNC